MQQVVIANLLLEEIERGQFRFMAVLLQSLVAPGAQLLLSGKRYVQDRSCQQKFAKKFFFTIVAKEIIEKKLCKKITYKCHKNRKNNKCNKIQDLEREKAKNGAEKSANVAKITRMFLATTSDKTVETIPSIFQLLPPTPFSCKQKM